MPFLKPHLACQFLRFFRRPLRRPLRLRLQCVDLLFQILLLSGNNLPDHCRVILRRLKDLVIRAGPHATMGLSLQLWVCPLEH